MNWPWRKKTTETEQPWAVPGAREIQFEERRKNHGIGVTYRHDGSTLPRTSDRDGHAYSNAARPGWEEGETKS